MVLIMDSRFNQFYIISISNMDNSFHVESIFYLCGSGSDFLHFWHSSQDSRLYSKLFDKEGLIKESKIQSFLKDEGRSLALRKLPINNTVDMPFPKSAETKLVMIDYL